MAEPHVPTPSRDPKDQKRLEKWRKQAQKEARREEKMAAKAHKQATRAQTAAARVPKATDSPAKRVEKESGGPTPTAAPQAPPDRKRLGRLARLRKKAAKGR